MHVVQAAPSGSSGAVPRIRAARHSDTAPSAISECTIPIRGIELGALPDLTEDVGDRLAHPLLVRGIRTDIALRRGIKPLAACHASRAAPAVPGPPPHPQCSGCCRRPVGSPATQCPCRSMTSRSSFESAAFTAPAVPAVKQRPAAAQAANHSIKHSCPLRHTRNRSTALPPGVPAWTRHKSMHMSCPTRDCRFIIE